MKKLIALILVFTTVMGLGACKKEDLKRDINLNNEIRENIKVIKFDKYSVELLDSLYENDKTNILISDLSIKMALSLCLEGANGNTQKELEKYLGYTKEEAKEINKMLISSMSEEDEQLIVSLSNSLWYDNDAKINAEYLKTLNDYYGATAQQLDLQGGEAVNTINNFVSEKTRGLIDKIVKETDLTDASHVFINTLYFKALWADKFYISNEDTFHGTGADRKVTMYSSVEDTYLENSKATGFMKSYFGKYVFVGILPKQAGNFKLSDLDVESLLKSSTYEYDVNIKVPKLDVEYSKELSGIMKQMGVTDSFNPDKADFSGIEDRMYIEQILHKTKLKLDEDGTEAAAVTAIIATCGTAMPVEKEEKDVFLDRPFAFMIYDVENDVALFTGKIVDFETKE